MLRSRAKIPVSFMQLPDALINGHLSREEKNDSLLNKEQVAIIVRYFFSIREHSV